MRPIEGFPGRAEGVGSGDVNSHVPLVYGYVTGVLNVFLISSAKHKSTRSKRRWLTLMEPWSCELPSVCVCV